MKIDNLIGGLKMSPYHGPRKGSVGDVDPLVGILIDRERRRQREKIVLIPSESICPPAVLEALASPFSNIYAEGYPWKRTLDEGEETLADIPFQHARHRRYYDRRFYKGCENANLIEALAGRRVRELFATRKNPAELFFANVQPLSGAAANNAVYTALLEPGDVIMGMSLMHGGHLTHGSEFNRSGKTYRAACYEVSPATERLDYDDIMKRAKECRPRLIIAGYTSYPWAPDWQKFREIADAVGAFLLADVAHPAGMIAAGVFPNPIDFADVVTFTTHKTLFGPRGAVILTPSREIAERVDGAVFPGEQGGPHVNVFAALAVAFGIAKTDAFRVTQKRIVENARRFASALEGKGLTLAYGGTDTHLLVVDLKPLKTKSGFPLKGDTAVRMLDIAGIAANKNTIPGDEATAEASGVRMGTPWITQRGITDGGIEELAALIADVILNIHPFTYRGLGGVLPRGKIELDLLENAKRRVRAVVQTLAPETGTPGKNPVNGAGIAVIEVRGARAFQFCGQVATKGAADIDGGKAVPTLLLAGDGRLIAHAVLRRLDLGRGGIDRFAFVVKREHGERVLAWLRGLSDGYVLFDEKDIYRKIEGPVAVEELRDSHSFEIACSPAYEGGSPAHAIDGDSNAGAAPYAQGTPAADLYRAAPELFDFSKPYFIGQASLKDEIAKGRPGDGGPDTGAAAPHSHAPVSQPGPGTRPSCLYDEHLKLTKNIVEFAGWKMPVRYEGILEEHRAVRRAAGLFDVTHMGVLEVSGENAERFLDFVTANYVPWMGDDDSQYSCLLEPDGSVIDDIMLYRVNRRRYLVVVNASNAEKDLVWLRELADGRPLIDFGAPSKKAPGPVAIRDLKSPGSGKDRLADVALQGPASPVVLLALASSEESRRSIRRIQKTRFCAAQIAGMNAIVSRTGYTGEQEGYELLVHPDDAPALWRGLLEAGERFGVKPAGLGARDSLRVEAGLPLYGHELSGPFGVSPLEAGFGPYVKFHKPFFIGRDELLKRERESTNTVVRFQKTGTGMKMSKQGDAVISKKAQRVIGTVTSCAVNGESVQVGMAFVERAHAREGTRLGIVPASAAGSGARAGSAPYTRGESFPVYDDAVVMSRFLGA